LFSVVASHRARLRGAGLVSEETELSEVRSQSPYARLKRPERNLARLMRASHGERASAEINKFSGEFEQG
jgi:hypothetical protein